MELKSHPLVSEAVVVGEGRRYLTALLTLDAEALGEWAHDRGKVADFEALASDPDLREEVDALVALSSMLDAPGWKGSASTGSWPMS